MDRIPLFEEIAESIRQQILSGTLQPEAELPPIREMAKKWRCSPGTVLRAYQELAEQGLIVSRPGAGTRVAAGDPAARSTPLRRAALVNQTESFLLSALSSGYQVEEIAQAVQMALDRWRALTDASDAPAGDHLRFVGSHDPALALLTNHIAQHVPDTELRISFKGSLGGLMALARREADVAGAHLWDAETESYNRSFVPRLLPGRRVALLSLADRHVGLITAPGNPLDLRALPDLTRPNVRFINRQPGAGTRVWLDSQLAKAGISPAEIDGYEEEVLTHTEVASAVGEGRADVGLGIEAAARTYGLDFVLLTVEHYDLIIPEEQWERAPVQALVAGLETDALRAAIDALGGYDTAHTGRVEWIA